MFWFQYRIQFKFLRQFFRRIDFQARKVTCHVTFAKIGDVYREKESTTTKTRKSEIT